MMTNTMYELAKICVFLLVHELNRFWARFRYNTHNAKRLREIWWNSSDDAIWCIDLWEKPYITRYTLTNTCVHCIHRCTCHRSTLMWYHIYMQRNDWYPIISYNLFQIIMSPVAMTYYCLCHRIRSLDYVDTLFPLDRRRTLPSVIGYLPHSIELYVSHVVDIYALSI